RAGSEWFDELWRAGRSSTLRAGTTTIEHPELGLLTLDCDMLLVPEADQTLVVYSAPPGTRAATALDLLRVTGAEQFA
ncbi:MmyB family transcriptional regulator, partial [Actinomadura kijaniata]|uniref:MmyB family transcriptional regulator n=1 Tax=Actinomadura kijaniata TaxID=46161 RepID=UPI000A5CDF34